MLGSSKIYIIDFEDSFTFNIASELYKFETNILIIPHYEFFTTKNMNDFKNKTKSPTAIILGPGPGNPEDHLEYFDIIKSLLLNPNIFLMGICLGHQILALIDGLFVRRSMRPMHGQQVKIDFNNQNILVQRYNSLAVYVSEKNDNEILIRNWDRGISYQFHPESIGTERSPLFFKDLLDFIR